MATAKASKNKPQSRKRKPVSSAEEPARLRRLSSLEHKECGEDEVIIYHYCSAQSLLSILENRTVRFGDARCMNDGEEVVWARRQLTEVIRRIVERDGIGDDIPAISRVFLEAFEFTIDKFEQISRHFLSSFSLEGDNLTQWRAYADDARGFSVGFKISDLDFPAQFLRVEYQVDNQQREMVQAIAEMFACFKRDSSYFSGLGLDHCVHLFGCLCSYKNPAFRDEREIRISHIVNISRLGGNLPQYQFVGGSVEGTAIEKHDIKYRTANGRIVPFIDFKFQLQSACALKEIYLGPKCTTTKDDIELLLGTLGYTDVEIKTAGSRYR